MRTGIALLPLDWGTCPSWLFERMKRLLRAILIEIVSEFDEEELLRRLAHPVWFQSLSAASGMDWNSSGTTTITMGALKEAIRGLENELGIFICGGKGKTSRKTPEQIQNWGEFLGLPMEKIDSLIYASKISAKVDSSCLQDLENPFQIYHHNLIFTRKGQWCVVQQGLNTNIQKARRYHWLSSKVYDFVEEPHSGIISDAKVKLLNLVAKESRENKEVSAELVKEEPKTFLKDIRLITKVQPRFCPQFQRSLELRTSLIKKRKVESLIEMELNDVEFHWHPVLKEKFDIKKLEKTIFAAHSENPENFEKLLSLKNVGPKTIRALSLVSEIIYGAKPSYEDPARYSFAHGGKDGTPRFVEKDLMDRTIEIIEKGIKKSKISIREKIEAQRRLKSLI